MTARATAAAYLGVMSILMVVAMLRWRGVDETVPCVELIPSRPATTRVADTSSLDRATADLVDHDPFRIANTPSNARYRLLAGEPTLATMPFVAHEPRPSLTLKAVAGGPPWQALIEGFPGQTHAMLVHAGTVVSTLVVREVTRDSVIIRGSDTTWVLRFARRL